MDKIQKKYIHQGRNKSSQSNGQSNAVAVVVGREERASASLYDASRIRADLTSVLDS